MTNSMACKINYIKTVADENFIERYEAINKSMTEKQHKPGCMSNLRCLVYHADGVCPGPYGKCTCDTIPDSSYITAHEPIGFEADAPEKEAECCHSCSIGGACEKSCDDPTLKHRKEKCNCEHTRVGLHDRLACQEYCLAKDCRCHDQRAETWEKRLKEEFWDRVEEVDIADIKSESIMLVSNEDVDWLIQSAVEAERRRISEEINERMFHCEGDDCMPLTKEVETILSIINPKK